MSSGMKSSILDNLFKQILSSPSLFKNRDALRPSYVPDELPHREEQITKLGAILATALKGGTPSNAFLYGKTGTGKTAVALYVLKYLENVCDKLGVSKPLTAYINCRIVDTCYRVLARLCEEVGGKVPFTGLPTDTLYEKFKAYLDRTSNLMIIVLDELDRLIKKNKDIANDVLYNLTRINSHLSQARVCVIGISNDMMFKDYLDPRVLSSLSEEEVFFPPYTADELRDILLQRVKISFNDGVVGDDVINLCAALAAREHGDARRALDLLRVAGEIAEREGASKVTTDHVWRALREIERDTVRETVRTLPLQSKLVLFSIYLLKRAKVAEAITGLIYETYKEVCQFLRIDPVTQRRMSDLLNDLDMLGLINARVISKGRYGRTKKITLTVPLELIKEVLNEDPFLRKLSDFNLPSSVLKR
ncbi:MAG: ORC1-type DNA replication protein [Candidatus Baldrarchaeia archaeon]